MKLRHLKISHKLNINKNFKINKKIKSRSGFTLLEMIIVISLISVFFTMVSLLVPFWYKAYARTVNLNYARQISNSVMGTIEEQIRFANDLEVINDGGVVRLTGNNASGRIYIPMKESTNLIDGLVYDDNFFINNDISLRFSLDADYCEVTVEVLRNGEKILEKSRTVMISGEN